MKSVLLSVRPEWVAKILNGEKTTEIRKKFPKDYVGWVYIYCTKKDSLGRIKDLPHDRYFVDCVETPEDFEKMDSGYDGKGKVVARFWCDKVEEIKDSLCEDIFDYAIRPKQCVEKWQRIYKESCLTEIELSNYLKAKNGYAIHITKLKPFDKPKDISEFSKKEFDSFITGQIEHYKYPLKRAPQSWCYVEI